MNCPLRKEKEDLGMKERKRPPWLRWLMLIVALGLCWAIWDDMELYARLEEQAIFSPAEWARAEADARFGWAVRGEGALLSLLAVLWAGLYWLLPLEGLNWAFWLVLLILLAGGAVLSWRKFSKIRPKHT